MSTPKRYRPATAIVITPLEYQQLLTGSLIDKERIGYDEPSGSDFFALSVPDSADEGF